MSSHSERREFGSTGAETDNKFRTGARIGLDEYISDEQYLVDSLYVNTAPR